MLSDTKLPRVTRSLDRASLFLAGLASASGTLPAMAFVEVAHLAKPESIMEIRPVAVLR
jgi:enamine deaminase RidA (YjgF/YER057c/UK114 family)